MGARLGRHFLSPGPPLEPLGAAEDDLDRLYGVATVDNAYVTSAHEVRPRLFLGSVAAALDAEELQERRLTHVVNCLGFTEEHFRDRVTYLTLDLADEAAQDVLTVLPKAHAFISAALASSPDARVLVHCLAGVSRSATVITAHLMAAEGLTAARALAEVQAARCCANPNTGFRAQLLQFEAALEGRRKAAKQPPLLPLTARIPLRR